MKGEGIVRHLFYPIVALWCESAVMPLFCYDLFLLGLYIMLSLIEATILIDRKSLVETQCKEGHLWKWCCSRLFIGGGSL